MGFVEFTPRTDAPHDAPHARTPQAERQERPLRGAAAGDRPGGGGPEALLPVRQLVLVLPVRGAVRGLGGRGGDGDGWRRGSVDLWPVLLGLWLAGLRVFGWPGGLATGDWRQVLGVCGVETGSFGVCRCWT